MSFDNKICKKRFAAMKVIYLNVHEMPNNHILTTFATSTNVLARIRNVGISWATFSMSAFAQGFASTIAQIVSSSNLKQEIYLVNCI